ALDRGMVPASRGGTSRSNTGSMRFANNIWFNGGNITFQTPSSSSVILPTTGTLATLAGIETFTNKTILSPNISNPTINGYALIRNGATLRGPIRIVDGSQTNNFILTSNAGGLAHWENLSTLLNGVNLSIDFLNDAITDRFSNIFVGNGSGISTSVSGLYNTGLGINSLNKNRNGDSNVAIGYKALYNGTSANGNIAIGYQAGNNISTGSRNITIGFDLRAVSPTANDQLNIGNTIFGNLSNNRIAINASTPDASLEVGDGTVNFIDGTDDALIADDLEVDGSIFTTSINGSSAAFTTGSITTLNTTTTNSTTINTTNLNASGTVNGSTFKSALNNGSVVFANASGVLSQNNAQFYWDRNNNRLGLGTNNPSQKLDVNGQLRIRGGAPAKDKVLASLDTAGNGTWMDISTILSNGGAFLDALNDAISDKNYNLFLGNGAGLVSTGRYNTGVGIDVMRTLTSGNGNTMYGFKAGNGMTSGSNNIFIGSDANGSSATASNELNIGDAIFGNLTNGNIGIGIQNPADFKLQVAGDIGPNTDDTYDLGSSSRRFNEAFINYIFAGQINGNVANFNTINSTTANLNSTTINSSYINNTNTITSATFNGVTANISGNVNGATFDGDFTNGSILFSNADGEIVENNSAFYWSSTNERLGIGTNDPSQSIDTTGQVRIRGGNPAKDKVLASLDSAGNGTWMDISTILSNGGAFLDALNDAISDKNYNLFLGNGAGLVSTGRYNTGVGIDAMRTLTTGNGNTMYGFKAGNGMTSGSNNIFIGSDANGSSTTASNELNIGNAIFGNLTNGNIGIGIQNPANFKLQVAGNIGPNTDNTYDLGSSSRRFNEAFINYIFAGQINGNVANFDTINSTTANLNSTTINSSYINNTNTITSDTFNGVTANISGRTSTGNLISTGNVNGTVANFDIILASTNINGATANFTTGNITTINSTDVNSTTINGDSFDGDFTNGSLLFSNAAGIISENNSMLFWSRNNNRLGLGTNAPTSFILDANGDIGPHRDATYNLGSVSRKWNKLFVQTLNANTLSLGFTDGSIIFSDNTGSLAQNNSQFFWDRSNNRLGIGTNAPAAALQVVGSIRASGQVNGVTANFTTGNITTISSSNISNSVTVTSNSFNGVTANISGNVNGGTFDGDFTNGSMLFSNATGVISQ
ncbi:MAG: hypothetical protein LW817_02235, partial [Candidatus Caenarcaniphilales bacterium]|nr:hypothetical protein [Candidatus Caenarcaniphilales bacterium]